ncbi:MAG: BREX-1 system phosphatase PglZ type A, partial [Rubritalea sp.]
SGNEIITTGQVSVTFYQTEAVTDKIQPRSMRAGIYSTDGELISDSHELIFDLSSEHARERELKVRFLLSKEAESHNGEEVILKLEEKNAKSSHYKEYKSLRYKIRRSISSDFDF